MEAITVPVYNTEGKEVDKIKLDASVFDGTVNTAVIYQAVKGYLANQRRGLASTKTMGEVSGGGRKPWKQKGTGRARVGSIRSPLWYHGGVVFGPHPRDFSYTVPAKIKDAALRSALCAKVKDDNFVVLDNFLLANSKTKDAAKIFTNLKLVQKKNKRHKTLLLLSKIDKNAKIALRNVGFLEFNLAKNTNLYEVLSAHTLVVTRDGLQILVDRLKK
ncbi:MAG TPA: 50S ribosomal protein L4 [Patescibacteria group bacterium]|nr:50S ribosomal protein L4 [Patescibacteria group bacterium]